MFRYDVVLERIEDIERRGEERRGERGEERKEEERGEERRKLVVVPEGAEVWVGTGGEDVGVVSK